MINLDLVIRITLPLPIILVLGGCVSTDRTDLQMEIDALKARPGSLPDPIPEIKPYEAYAYQSGEKDLRDPFQSFYRETAEIAELDPNAGLSKEMERELRNRNREELEQYELDSLRMVGIMNNKGNNWGVIMDPDRTVHRVKVGNYMGRNVGKVVNIFEDRIELREIFKNSQGRWEERQASIALVEIE